MDREFTAPILKRYPNGWRIARHTTFIVHNPKRTRTSLFNDDLLGFRREYRYGAGIVDPKFLNLKVTSITNC